MPAPTCYSNYHWLEEGGSEAVAEGVVISGAMAAGVVGRGKSALTLSVQRGPERPAH